MPFSVSDQPLSGRAQIPAVLEHAEDPVELATERAVVALDPGVDLGEFALEPLGLRGGAHPLAQVRIELDRVHIVARPVAATSADLAQRCARQPLGDLPAVLAILRLERARQPHLAERLDRPDHVVGA